MYRKYFQLVLLCFLNNWHQTRNNVGIHLEEDFKIGIFLEFQLNFQHNDEIFSECEAIRDQWSSVYEECAALCGLTDQSVPSSHF